MSHVVLQYPSIGRSVHYHPADGVIEAALIVAVQQSTVTLAVWSTVGIQRIEPLVSLAPPGVEKHWSWPPRS